MILTARVAAFSSRAFSYSRFGGSQPIWLANLSLSDDVVRGYQTLAQKRRKKIETDRKLIDAVPTPVVANSLPLACHEMDNASLLVLSAMGKYDARVEILKRHIMACDKVSYEVACQTFQLISSENRKWMWLSSLPYQVGIVTALAAGAASFPLCFHLPTVEWFNVHFVTTDVPEPKDLETFLEVGSWAWNWMEPPLGQVSFFLLCLQFSRAQLSNLGIRPYTQKMKQMRGLRLAKKFPQYSSKILKDFSMADDIIRDS